MQVSRIEKVRKAMMEGEYERARILVVELLEENPQDKIAWLFLSLLITDKRKKVYCLERVQSLDPNHKAGKLARVWLSELISGSSQKDDRRHNKLNDLHRFPKSSEIHKSEVNSSPEKSDLTDRFTHKMACPHLGLLEDPFTHTMYTNGEHRCYRSDEPLPVGISHQNRYCLSKDFSECPIYAPGLENFNPSMIGGSQIVRPQGMLNKNLIIGVLLLGAFIIAIIFVLIYIL